MPRLTEAELDADQTLCDEMEGHVQSTIALRLPTYIAEVRRLNELTEPKWISVNDRLPAGGVTMALVDPGDFPYPQFAICFGQIWYEAEHILYEGTEHDPSRFSCVYSTKIEHPVTHWCPLPNPHTALTETQEREG